jgi:hypothetical protein
MTFENVSPIVIYDNIRFGNLENLVYGQSSC